MKKHAAFKLAHFTPLYPKLHLQLPFVQVPRLLQSEFVLQLLWVDADVELVEFVDPLELVLVVLLLTVLLETTFFMVLIILLKVELLFVVFWVLVELEDVEVVFDEILVRQSFPVYPSLQVHPVVLSQVPCPPQGLAENAHKFQPL